jgi:peptidoglycan hydrolase CwlO-like protein
MIIDKDIHSVSIGCLQKHVTKLETKRTEEIDKLKDELAKLMEENQEAASTIDEHNLVLKNLNNNLKKTTGRR